MLTKVSSLGVRNLVFIALFFMSVLPLVVHSQIENSITSKYSIEKASSTKQNLNSDLSINPYPIESLIGDKVFGDFVLGPGKIELEINPGESKTIEITVTNRFADTRLFQLDIEDVGSSNDPTRPAVLLGDDRGPYVLRDFISIPKMKFSLANNKRARIPVTITMPIDAEAGGHYGSVLVKTLTSPAYEGDLEKGTAPASAIVSRIGTLFFITVPGDIETTGKLQQFSIKNDKKYFASSPIDFNILYENTGAIHLNPYGEIQITNMFGEEVGFMELDPWFTLPKSVRLREISWNREFLYGRYTAKLSLNRGYDDIIDEASVTFWVIPWKILTFVSVFILIIFFLVRSFFRKFEFKRKSS